MWTTSTLPTYPGNPCVRYVRSVAHIFHCFRVVHVLRVACVTREVRRELLREELSEDRCGNECALRYIVDQCAPLARRSKLANSSSRGGTLLLLVRVWKSPTVVILSLEIAEQLVRNSKSLVELIPQQRMDGFRRSPRSIMYWPRSPYPTRHTSARGPLVDGSTALPRESLSCMRALGVEVNIIWDETSSSSSSSSSLLKTS